MNHQILEEIPIEIKNEHQLLNLLAEGYKSLGKALMEYIDNAFDSADDFFNPSTQQYERDVNIDVIIDRSENKILIKDNCCGMSLKIMKGLANSVNDSEKKRREQKRAWINGQFGLGAHAYRFFAEQLIVISKQQGATQNSITIERDSPYAKLIKYKRQVDFKPSGTLIELLDIDKTQMKGININELGRDIQIYFEMLLLRNVKITIMDGETKYCCTPYDYNALDGISIKKVITSWNEGTAKITVPEEKGVSVNLKVCLQKVDRPPFFSRKGRRVNYISNMDSFIRQTGHRKKVWESYYLTGFIEIQDNLEPVTSRDDFAGGKGKIQKRSGIYREIVKLEDEIYSAIEMINKDKSDESMRQLASRLSEILTTLSREDSLKLKHQDDGNEQKKTPPEKIKTNPSGSEYEIKTRGDVSPPPNPDPNSEPNPHYVIKTIVAVTDPSGDIEGRKMEPQQRGVRIDFSMLPSDKRAHYGDGVITIFTNHPDFQDRKGTTQRGELGQMKITARLANYLAAIISSEYKEVFYQQKRLEPNRKLVLEEQIDFIFRFENRLKDFINQTLDSIGKLDS